MKHTCTRQVAMRGASLLNGVSGVAALCGSPVVPRVPEAWRREGDACVKRLKQPSSADDFGAVHALAMQALEASQGAGPSAQEGAASVASKTVRGLGLRELQRFLDEKDPTQTYAGTQRVPGKAGRAIWTALGTREEVEQALEERDAARRRALREEEEGHTAGALLAAALAPPSPAPPRHKGGCCCML